MLLVGVNSSKDEMPGVPTTPNPEAKPVISLLDNCIPLGTFIFATLAFSFIIATSLSRISSEFRKNRIKHEIIPTIVTSWFVTLIQLLSGINSLFNINRDPVLRKDFPALMALMFLIQGIPTFLLLKRFRTKLMRVYAPSNLYAKHFHRIYLLILTDVIVLALLTAMVSIRAYVSTIEVSVLLLAIVSQTCWGSYMIYLPGMLLVKMRADAREAVLSLNNNENSRTGGYQSFNNTKDSSKENDRDKPLDPAVPERTEKMQGRYVEVQFDESMETLYAKPGRSRSESQSTVSTLVSLSSASTMVNRPLPSPPGSTSSPLIFEGEEGLSVISTSPSSVSQTNHFYMTMTGNKPRASEERYYYTMMNPPEKEPIYMNDLPIESSQPIYMNDSSEPIYMNDLPIESSQPIYMNQLPQDEAEKGRVVSLQYPNGYPRTLAQP